MMQTEKIPKLLWKLALPATVGMLVNALYNIVDTIFIGQSAGYLAIGGLTIAFPVQMLILGIAQMIGIGAASVLSRSLGAKDDSLARKVVGNAYAAVILLGVLLCTFGLIFLDPILRIFGATEILLPYARDYLGIILIGSVYFPFAVSTNNLIRAEGNARAAMFSMIVGAVLNIGLDYLFIFPFGMGIRGAALATILSQLASVIYILIYIWKGKKGKSALKVKLTDLKPKLIVLRQIITVGFPSLIMQVSGSLLAIVLNHSLGYYGGEIAISVYGVIQRIILFLSMPMFGIVQGMQPIAGYNYGAKQPHRIREVVKLSIIAATVIVALGTLLTELFPGSIIALFEDNALLIENGIPALRTVIALLPVVGLQLVGAIVFQAFGKALPSTLLTVSRQIVLLIPLVLLLPQVGGLGLFGIWLAFPAADLLSALLTAILLTRELKRLPGMAQPDNSSIQEAKAAGEWGSP
jgi:putative MATE family efflux protein